MRTTFGKILIIAAAIAALTPSTAAAQDALSRVKGFYESADYEGALNVLATLNGSGRNSEVAAYRVFCLVALGRKDEAKAAVEEIVRQDPLFRPSDSSVSPRLRSFFDDVRKPLLPEVVRGSYNTAKAAFDAKSWAIAVTEFDRVLTLLIEIGDNAQGVSDLKTLAKGFRDLAHNATLPPPAPPEPKPTPTPTPAPKPAAPPEPSIYGIENTEVKRPVAVAKPMPEWRPENAVEERMSFTGALELVIDEQGKVISTRIIDPSHPRYDAALLKAATSWTFRPATKDGKPVKFRYSIAVQLGR